jgi:hypothetical protein
MISFCNKQQPQVGYKVRPNIVNAGGTSSLHGMAAEHAAQHT